MGIRLPLVVGAVCAAAVGVLAAGQSGVAAQSSAPVAATRTYPEQVAAIGGAVTPATSGSITGTVRGAGNKAVAGYTVEAFTVDGNFVADTVTDAQGAYNLTGLQAGSYKVRFSGPVTGAAPWAMAWAGGSPVMTKAAVVNVGATPIAVKITLPAAATVTGRVAGVPVGSEVRVCGGTFVDCRMGTTANDGRFTVSGLAAGQASIVVRPAGGTTELAFPKQPPRPGVPLQGGLTTNVTLDAASQAAPTVTVGGKPVRPASPRPAPPDRTAPTVTAAKLSNDNGKRYVQVDATDGQGGSGLAKVQVRVDSKELTPSRFTSDAVAAPGTGEVAVRVQDKAGNYSGWVVAK